MIIYNYSKCPIRYYCSEEKSLLLKFKNLKFVLDYKSSAPDFSGITHGIYDVDTDILYFQYDFENFKNNIHNIISKDDFLNYITRCLYSNTRINGIGRCVY